MKNYNQKLLITYQSPMELAEELAHKVSWLLQQAINARNRATLVVSGGSTPKLFFQKLAQKDIEWPRVTITLADERWVAQTNPASNEHLVRRYLLQDKARAAQLIGLKNKYATAAAGEKNCNDRLAEIPGPFDVVVLGMGTDGHTASFFPDSLQLRDALDTSTRAKCMAVTSANAGHTRMTMTLSALLDARQIFVHITGEKKMAVLEKALTSGPVEEMPIRSILRQDETPVQIFWSPQDGYQAAGHGQSSSLSVK